MLLKTNMTMLKAGAWAEENRVCLVLARICVLEALCPEGAIKCPDKNGQK
jgi:hypothetical protein